MIGNAESGGMRNFMLISGDVRPLACLVRAYFCSCMCEWLCVSFGTFYDFRKFASSLKKKKKINWGFGKISIKSVKKLQTFTSRTNYSHYKFQILTSICKFVQMVLLVHGIYFSNTLRSQYCARGAIVNSGRHVMLK